MTLQTRKPTGAVPWPLVLIEGGEKVGKSYACAVLSASEKVGRTLWLDWAEGAADEYGAVPGARYEVIEHDGTWNSIYGQVLAAKAEAQRAADAGEPPVVLIIDSISAAWEFLKDWASARARTTDTNRKKLERDPNAEVTVTMNLWNDAGSRHRKLMTALMTFPGIVVLTARGGEVALVEGVKPVEGKKTYRVEGHKNLGFDVSFWLRLSRDRNPVVVGARSVHSGVRPGIDTPDPVKGDWSLEWLIFDVLKCDPKTAHVRDLVEPDTEALTPEQIRDELADPQTDFARVRELYALIQQHGYDTLELTNEHGDDEQLLHMAKRIGDERRPAGQNGPGPATRPAVNGDGPGNGAAGQRQQRGPQRPPADGASQRQQRPAQVEQVNPGAEEKFIRDFNERLAATTTPDAARAMKQEATRAAIGRTITKPNHTNLTNAAEEHATELEQAGVPA